MTVLAFRTPTGNQAVPLYNSNTLISVLNLIDPAPAFAVLCAVFPKGIVKPGEPNEILLPILFPYPYDAGTAVSIPITTQLTFVADDRATMTLVA